MQTLTIAGALSVLTGAAFAVVAYAVSHRPATGPQRLARFAHASWWGGLGGYLVLQGALTLAAAQGSLTLAGYLASRWIAIPLLTACVWGLTFYLTYLYTGHARAAIPLAVLFGLTAILFFYATFARAHVLHVETWIVAIDDDAPLYRIVYTIIGLPPILASLAYFGLLRRVRERAQRYRIVLVAGSILGYVGSGLAARLAASDGVIFVTLVVFGLGAAVASLMAYYPPAAIRRRLGGLP